MQPTTRPGKAEARKLGYAAIEDGIDHRVIVVASHLNPALYVLQPTDNATNGSKWAAHVAVGWASCHIARTFESGVTRETPVKTSELLDSGHEVMWTKAHAWES